MRKFVLISALCSGLMACSPPVPDSAKGVGFDNYDTYLAEQRAREAQQSTQNQTVRPPETSAEQTAADAVAAVRPQGQTTTTTASSARAAQPNNPNISDEQDFEAVSARRTIEDDAARVQEKRQQYAVVRPTAVPNRPSGAAPTPIQFALATSHPVGQKVYRRPLTASTRKAQAECLNYSSAEVAQDQFLKNGGPEKDRLGIDPDGDGYACGWNPATYRGLVRR